VAPVLVGSGMFLEAARLWSLSFAAEWSFTIIAAKCFTLGLLLLPSASLPSSTSSAPLAAAFLSKDSSSIFM
jgi:hypothetical protein